MKTHKLYAIEGKKYQFTRLYGLIALFIAFQGMIALVPLFKLDPSGFSNSMIWHRIMDGQGIISVIISPIFLATLTSYGVDLEHRHNMWRVIQSSGLSYVQVYKVKLLFLLNHVALYVLGSCLLTYALARLKGVTASLPLVDTLYHVGTVLVVSFALSLVHYCLALRYKNQMVTLAVALVGSLSGMMSVFISELLMKLNPYSWYAYAVRMNSDPSLLETLKPMESYPIIASLVLIALAYLIGKRTPIGE